jgi:hypothetical protein
MNCPSKAPLLDEIMVKGTQSSCAARESAGKQSFCHAMGGPAEPARYVFGDFGIAFATLTLLEGAW